MPRTLIAAALIGLVPLSADAGVAITANSTQAFLGVNIAFGPASTTPEVVLGLVNTRTNCFQVTGAKASVSFGLTDGFRMRNIRLTGLDGTMGGQAEFGAGYNLNKGFFGTLGGNGRFYQFGVDVGFGGYQAYVGATSIDQFLPVPLVC
jgi:hypothetical protein